MNPISIDDIEQATDFLLNPEYLICVSKETHDAIHYGIDTVGYAERKKVVERRPNDTKLW